MRVERSRYVNASWPAPCYAAAAPLPSPLRLQKGEFLEDNLAADVSARLREPAALAVLTRSDKKRA